MAAGTIPADADADGHGAHAPGTSASGSDDTGPGLRERLAALLAGSGRRLVADGPWLCVFGGGDGYLPDHGWKLHVSARAADLSRVVDLVVPVLLRYGCDAKFAAGAGELRAMNSGERDPALVGKAVTVYPRPADVTALGGELAELLAGRPGPRVLSDRRIRPDSPVSYRYGPFRATGADDAALTMTGPGGAAFPGRAGTRYRTPPWAADPFRAEPPRARPAGLIGGRYRLTSGIARSPHGDVYRAVDAVTGERVVVKQARAYAGEDGDGVDARGRLRHEHAVLAALAGVDGVPAVRDHVRHGDDEYLVTTDRGPRDLRRDVLAHGPYEPAGARPGGGAATGRGFAALVRRLVTVLDGVHSRGVVVGDIKPSNVVLGADGAVSLVDFGVSALHGERPAGATPGYSMPAHRAGGPPRPADDLYALGATLYFALTGMDPVVVDRDDAVNRDRTLACLAGALPGAVHRPARELVAGLTDPDPVRRTAWARRGCAPQPPAPGHALPAPPRITPGLLDDLIAHTVRTCAAAAADMPAGARSRDGRRGSGATLYDGAAGLGLELLHHTDRPGVREAVAGLARRTAGDPELPTLAAGLYVGRTGVDLFLDSAAALTGLPAASAAPRGPRPYDGTGDQISGAAGAGTGLLALARHSYAAGRAAEGDARTAAAGECARALMAAEDGRERAEPQMSAAASEAAFAFGFGHGSAGAVHFLFAYHRRTGDRAAGAAARRGLDELVAHTPRLLALAARPEAHRRYGSWCRGLAGIGTVLIEAGEHDADPRATDLGVRCARACRALAPRMSPVSQCCGLSGVGELLVDAAAATGDGRLHRAAEEVAGLILARSGGTPRRPLFPDNTLTGSGPGWATGSAGVLSFLRRLRDRGGPRLWA